MSSRRETTAPRRRTSARRSSYSFGATSTVSPARETVRAERSISKLILPDRLEDAESVETREHQVEDDEIGPGPARALEPRRAVARNIHLVALDLELKEKNPDGYNFGIDQVALVGNRLLRHRRLREALEIFRLAAGEEPKESVLQARIGETSTALGNREASLTAYEKALELAPQNPEAMEMIRRLEAPVAGK